MGANLAQIVIVTGLSGSGKSTALRALEDLGFFCIDNLPIVLLPRLLELGSHTSETVQSLGLVVDARETEFLPDAPEIVREARHQGHEVEVLFLDATDPVLLRRFSETRRRHPLATAGSVEAGIAAEREALEALRQLADEVIDTSGLSVHELGRIIQDRHGSSEAHEGPRVTVLSFGFKHGLPPQADLVFDCRFLPNPYFVDELRPKSGQDPEVADYVFDKAEAGELLERLDALLGWLLPFFQNERKRYLTVAIGCTGGQHRSVAMAERLAQRLAARQLPITLRHRDMKATP
ncbi:MAG: RNase adapter RapZ [Deltaproteobacteria bacterium]|nr:RNase adapter RapZ [Deltaproteobacteria bacterium]